MKGDTSDNGRQTRPHTRLTRLALIATALLGRPGLADGQDVEPVLRARLPELLAVVRSSDAREEARVAALNDAAQYVRLPNGDPATRKMVLAAVLDLLKEGTPTGVTIAAIETLRTFDIPRTLTVLAHKCGADSMEVRLAALEAAAQVGRVAAMPTLLYALSDADSEVVDEAGRLLEQLSWAQETGNDPRATWRTFLRTGRGEALLIAALTKLRCGTGKAAPGPRGIPVHVVALLLDDQLGDAAWQEARRFLAECVPGLIGPGTDRGRVTTALRESWSEVTRASRAERAHGRAQLARMLADRPEMSADIEGADEFHSWAVRLFNGEELGFPVYWNSATPANGFEADHRIPAAATVAIIRLRPLVGESPALFEKYWRAIIYEANNLRGAEQYRTLCRAAFQGDLNREEWVRRATMLEFAAASRLRQFYFDRWQPWAAKNGARSTPELWFVGAGSTYQEWIARYKDHGAYPYIAWGSYYDDVVAPAVANTRKCEQLRRSTILDGTVAEYLKCLECTSVPQELRLSMLEAALAHRRRSRAEVGDDLVGALSRVLSQDVRANIANEGSATLRAAAHAHLVALMDGSSEVVVSNRTRVVAMNALADVEDIAAIPMLQRAASDEDASIAGAADRWLARICWSDREKPLPWQEFFLTEDGEKMLRGAFAKLGAMTGGR